MGYPQTSPESKIFAVKRARALSFANCTSFVGNFAARLKFLSLSAWCGRNEMRPKFKVLSDATRRLVNQILHLVCNDNV